MSDTKYQVRRYIDDNFIMGSDGTPFTDADSLLDLHIVDSTGILELILFLEETFGIQVLDAEMVPENLDSLNAIEAYVQRKHQTKVAA
ncbi:putative Acyl carrier protein [Thiomonas sp. X19]|uniref:acyl carrier protein n=1 Tax=Thiomonas sp. X19 TaxID=1050370 RepID=UPI000B767767|nr:acyl carrier protein [Thiomonas sp. X19]SCC93222.1 putative Acyl carrier protein [Thiomonas sp. X19]